MGCQYSATWQEHAVGVSELVAERLVGDTIRFWILIGRWFAWGIVGRARVGGARVRVGHVLLVESGLSTNGLGFRTLLV